MADCDGFFDERGIGYGEEWEDAAVYAVRSADFYDPAYKKWLIICWYDTSYGQWNGSRFNLKDSRAKMSHYLGTTSYNTFEELIAAPVSEKP